MVVGWARMMADDSGPVPLSRVEKNNELPRFTPTTPNFFFFRYGAPNARRIERESPEKGRGSGRESDGRFIREERKRRKEEEPHASDLHTRPAGCRM